MAALIAFCTVPDEDAARTIATALIERRLVACANILPKVESIHRWQGKIEQAPEALVAFKLEAARYADFEESLRKLHPYDVPEIIAWEIDKVLPDYLRWIHESCAPET